VDEDLALHEVRQFVARIMAMDAMWDARKKTQMRCSAKRSRVPKLYLNIPGFDEPGPDRTRPPVWAWPDVEAWARARGRIK